MFNTTCNTTLADLSIHEEPLVGSFTFHRIGLIVSAVCGLVSILISFWLIYKHATHYLRPWEQKHIIRILFMIPIYSAVSFLSFYFYRHTIYYQVLRDCYEAFAIASFFTLLCNYLQPTLHDQKEYFRKVDAKNWLLPISWLQRCTGGQSRGPFRRPRSGLTLFNILWLCVFQYCFVRVIFTVVSVISQATDRYCEASLSPVFAHIWVLSFEAVSVTIAMYGLIQFYYQLKSDIREHRPFLKILCIKLVIFFSFWQTELISFVSSANGPFQPTKHISYPDIKVGIPAMLLCIEMMIFAIMHLFAFPWRIYSITSRSNSDPLTASGSGWSGKEPQYLGGPLGIKAYAEAFNPWDMIKATARGIRWLFVGRRFREEDPSYNRSGIATKLEPLQGTYTPDSNQSEFPPTQFSGSNGYTNQSTSHSSTPPSRMPYPGDAVSDTSYQGAIMPHIPNTFNEFDNRELAPRQTYNAPNRTYHETQTYPRSITGSAAQQEYYDDHLQHEEEDHAGLLRNAAKQGQSARGTSRGRRPDDSDDEAFVGGDQGSIVHPAFR